ncbi:ATP-binding protein [Candidatus Parabeggiatoa sp. HSG14]|uniref:ATP-binding protein n=1 Tax=Candidatus Parabeggiatoa sp. HSG14 TaxID=3055593 RepID=UPI0025A9107E|nr:ATP-binding protein [Thiotrichales bacterium HSG14]
MNNWIKNNLQNQTLKRIVTYIALFIILFIGYSLLREVTWQGSKPLHTVMEIIATFLALIVGTMALVRFYTKKNNTFLFIGTGFLGTAMLDGYHAVVTSTFFDFLFPSPPPSLIPWSWIASRLFLSILLWLSWLVWRREEKLGQLGVIKEQVVYLSVGGLTLVSFIFFAFVPLPRAYYPELFFHRPEEFIPAFFFLLTLVGYLKKGHWKTDDFEHWLILSIIVAFMSQTMFMSFSGYLFDTMFDAAHFLKKVSYIGVLIGLLISMYKVFWQSEKVAQQLLQANKKLKKQQVELIEKEERFREIVEGTEELITRVDKHAQFLYVNYTAKKILGVKPDKCIGLCAFDFVHPDDRQRTEIAFYKWIQNCMLHVTFENRQINQKTGEIHHIYWNINLHYDAKNHLTGINSIAHDITEQKKLKVERHAKKEAETANRAKSTFLANMSHELRTPLNGILGYAQILTRDKSLNAKQKEGIDIIQRSGDYLLTLINDILDLSKIEAGKIELYPTDFHFGQFIQGITELFQMRVQQKNIAFNYEPLSHLPIGVKADEKRVRQVLINLLGNAVKFTKKGGIALKIGYHDGKMRFQVEDTGVGIASDEFENIFQPFQQVGDSNYRAEGTGLGLSITKKLVEMMGGKLQVESTFGHGSTFWFVLDLPEVSIVKFEKAGEPVIIGFKGLSRKILVVDDKWENRLVLVNLLKPLGFEIWEANDGQEYLAKAQEINPDLILTDLVMPVMDGFEATRQIRKISAFKNTPVIATSASVFESDKQDSLDAGCNDFIAKPIRVGLLLEKLKNHLELEWIKETTLDSHGATNVIQNQLDKESKESEDSSNFVGPSPEQAAILFDLAMMGDIGGIVEELDSIEQSDKRLFPFCHQVRQLAKTFDEGKICDLIEPYVQ